jgi:hypothetical protein
MRPRLSYRWSGASFRNIHNVFHTFKLIIAPAKPGKLKSRSNRVREVMQINRSPFSKVARVLVRLNHVASIIVNANHRIVRAAAMFGVTDCVRDCIRLAVPQPTEWQRVGKEIDAAMIFPRADLVNVD